MLAFRVILSLLFLFRLPLPEEDYHEFIVKSERKFKTTIKKKFIFPKQSYDPNDHSTNNIWKPNLEKSQPSKKVNLLQGSLISEEEMLRLQEEQHQIQRK